MVAGLCDGDGGEFVEEFVANDVVTNEELSPVGVQVVAERFCGRGGFEASVVGCCAELLPEAVGEFGVEAAEGSEVSGESAVCDRDPTWVVSFASDGCVGEEVSERHVWACGDGSDDFAGGWGAAFSKSFRCRHCCCQSWSTWRATASRLRAPAMRAACSSDPEEANSQLMRHSRIDPGRTVGSALSPVTCSTERSRPHVAAWAASEPPGLLPS